VIARKSLDLRVSGPVRHPAAITIVAALTKSACGAGLRGAPPEAARGPSDGPQVRYIPALAR